MNHLIGIALALAASASLASAEGGPEGKPSLLSQGGSGGNVTFKPGSGITFDGGDAFSLNFGGRIQAKWRFVNADMAPDTNGFRLRRARTWFGGHLYDRNVEYYLQLGHEDTGSNIKDAWLRWNFVEGDTPVSLRMGQQKFLGSLQWATSNGSMMFVERSLAARTFADARSVGALLEGSLLEDQNLHWFFGAHNTDQSGRSSAAAEESTNNGENELNFTAGVRFDPHGNVGSMEKWDEGDLNHSGEVTSTFGASIAIVNEQVGGVDVEANTINIFGALKSGTGLTAQGEVFLRSDDVDGGGSESDSMGWYVQGTMTAEPRDNEVQYGGGIRVAMVDFDDAPIGLIGSAAPLDGGPAILTATAGDVFEINASLSAFYHKHKLKTQLGYTFQQVSPTGGTDLDNHALELMVTANF